MHASAQVAYPGQSVSLPINATAGLIPVPASVDYSVTMLTAVDEPILPMLNGSLDGTLAWDPAHGGGAAIALPINWTAVRVFLISLSCCTIAISLSRCSAAHVMLMLHALQITRPPLLHHGLQPVCSSKPKERVSNAGFATMHKQTSFMLCFYRRCLCGRSIGWRLPCSRSPTLSCWTLLAPMMAPSRLRCTCSASPRAPARPGRT